MIADEDVTEDEDEDEEEDEGTEEGKGKQPLAAAEPESLKAALYGQLQRRLAAENDPRGAGMMNQARADVQNSMNKNQLYAALAASAAGAGTVAGKQASAAPVEQYAQNLNTQAGMQAQDLVAEAARGDKERDTLYKALAQQAGIELQGKKLEETTAYHKGVIGEKRTEAEERKANQDEAHKFNEKKLAIDAANAKANIGIKQAHMVDVGLKAQQHQDEALDKDATAFGKEIDSGRASSRTALGRAAIAQQNAERVDALVKSFNGDLNNATPQQVRELASAVGAMTTSGSQLTQQQIEEFVPHSIVGDAAKFKQWITNNPAGTNQSAFIQKFLDTAQREKELAVEQQKHYAVQTLNGHSRLVRTPQGQEMAKNMLRGMGINDDELVAQGGAFKYMPKKAPAQMPGPGAESGTAIAAPTAAAGGQKTLARKQYNAGLNKTKLIYSDGSSEIVDGKQ